MLKRLLGQKMAMLAKSIGKSQTEIAGNLDMPISQLNRFFRGHSDIGATNLAAILQELGIDLEELVSARIRKQANIDDGGIDTVGDCVQFLYKRLDDLGRQAYLNNLAWAARLTSKSKLPEKVENMLSKELDLI